MTLKDFLKNKPYLVWYVKDINKISAESAVEAVLNYGDFDDVKKLIKILGMKKTAAIFHKNSRQSRSNYRPEIKHYFNLYFKKHALA